MFFSHARARLVFRTLWLKPGVSLIFFSFFCSRCSPKHRTISASFSNHGHRSFQIYDNWPIPSTPRERTLHRQGAVQPFMKLDHDTRQQTHSNTARQDLLRNNWRIIVRFEWVHPGLLAGETCAGNLTYGVWTSPSRLAHTADLHDSQQVGSVGSGDETKLSSRATEGPAQKH